MNRRVTRSVIVIALVLGASVAAIAGPPRGYRCGRGGWAHRGTCHCPLEKMPARDDQDRAVCVPKPEPAATACLADRKGKQWLSIDSSPSGATLYLGDKGCGVVARTPWRGRVQPGPVKVILELNGYDTLERTLPTTAGARAELFAPLVRIELGTITVRGDADANMADAKVSIDGQDRGGVPVMFQARAGRHLVEVAKQGYENYAEWVTVEDGRTVTLLPTLTAVKVATARIVVDADVPQAAVALDGKQVGTTPIAIDKLALGVHTIEVSVANAKPWKKSMMLGAGTTLIHAELAAWLPKDPTHAIVHVTSKPKGAEIRIDGTTAGLAPLDHQVAPGNHWIQVRMPAHMPFEQKLDVVAGQSYSIAATLIPSGTLHVTSTPAGSTVFVDGVRHGTTPVVVDVPSGDHTIFVERRGYRRFTQKVTVSARKTTKISAALHP